MSSTLLFKASAHIRACIFARARIASLRGHRASLTLKAVTGTRRNKISFPKHRVVVDRDTIFRAHAAVALLPLYPTSPRAIL